MFILAVCMLFLAAMPFWSAWDAYRYAQVKSMEDVGSIASAAYQNSGFFSPATSAITTENGTFVVEGILKGVKGHRMRIEYRGNGSRALCDLDADICKRMLRH